MSKKSVEKVRLFTIIEGFEGTGLPRVIAVPVKDSWDSSNAALEGVSKMSGLKVTPKLATITGSYEAATMSLQCWQALQKVLSTEETLDLVKSAA